MKNGTVVILMLVLGNMPALSQQRQPLRPGRPALEDMVEGFYIGQFPQQVEVGDEQYAKILPVLRQHLKDRREISARRTRSLNQLRMMVQRGASDDDIRRTIADIDKADADAEASRERFLSNVDPLLTVQQQARVRIFQVAIEQRIRQMLDRIQNAPRR